MQRCPYIHEMKERLLSTGEDAPAVRIMPAQHAQHTPEPQVPTIVKLNSEGYAHTSPLQQRAPLAVVECGEAVADPTEELLTPGGSLNYAYLHVDTTPKNAKTSLFIITSFIYAKLLVVVCLAYVFSDVITHNLPLYYYEAFFTYLYGVSILFLLYVFCFLLQESACCAGSPPKPKPPPKEKKPKKEKVKKTKEEKKEAKDGKDKKDGKEKKDSKSKDKAAKKEEQTKESKKQSFQQQQQQQQQQLQQQQQQQQLQQEQQQSQQDIVELESGPVVRPGRRRKTTQNDHSHGSFFLRIGAIAFGLGTMIYNGLEFGTFFEIPFTSPCYLILKGINPVLQMIFTFMQMYFIFMNSRLNIHRFKVIARFGLMHVVATNICVWIRTLVLESLKEITNYHLSRPDVPEDGILSETIRRHTLRNAGRKVGEVAAGITTAATTTLKYGGRHVANAVAATTARAATPGYGGYASGLIKAIKTTIGYDDSLYRAPSNGKEAWYNDDPYLSTTTTSTAATATSTTTMTPPTTTQATSPPTLVTHTQTAMLEVFQWIQSTLKPLTTSSTLAPSTADYRDDWGFNEYRVDPPRAPAENISETFESLDTLNSAALVSVSTYNASACGRVNIMGNIVAEAAPYLYPFIIEYCLIGAAVIYVMWKHIGRCPSRANDEDVERRLEAVLSRRAAALAAARRGARVDCAGASKGLFCGLLLLVASLICLILFFVLVRQAKFGLLAIYLADVSHCALMALSILAILIGFIRVRSLKFRSEEQSDLNDILLRVSAFGLFIYATFSVIAGSLGAFTHEPNLLVMITGILSVVQVVLQLLFIADVSRRRVHLPEQERSKPARQAVTFLLICNITMWLIYTFEAQKVQANPVQLDFYGFVAWSLVQRITLPLCIFHRFHSAVTLAEIWKTSYKARLE